MKSLIYGYGITGKSFERYLKKTKKNYDIYDMNIPEYSSEPNLNLYDVIYCSPGIPKAEFLNLKKNNMVMTDLDIFFIEDESIKIGVTGTNRKSTTCFHLFQIINLNHSVNLVGNIGNPMLDVINNGKKYSIIELSSYQLDKMNQNKLDYGILLNISPDHIDYHGNFEEYKKVKEKILSSKNFSNENDPYKLQEWITGDARQNINLNDLPFRFQKITSSIINDSKSTNSDSLAYAIKKAKDLFAKNYSLVLCGDPSKEGFSKIKINGPDEVIIFGKHKDDIKNCISHNKKLDFVDLEEALNYLKNKKNILFSPGYPSGKDYKNFEERGNHFNSLVKEIINGN